MTTPESELSKVKAHLKDGTILLPRVDHTFVGRSDRGLEVSSPARAALAAMDGASTCEELSQRYGIPISDILALVDELDRANFVDTQTSKISVHTRFHSPNAHRASHDGDDSNDGAYQQLQAKLLPELSATTWLANVRDGGVSIIDRRRDWHIGIYGQSRIATLLYGILLSSGITRVSLQGIDDHKRIGEEDLCAGFLHPSDIGLLHADRIRELSRELSLFPTSNKEREEKPHTFMVATGNAPADLIQQWMSDGIPHLLIDTPECASMCVGPIVIPGQTPCARCISLAREDQNPTWHEVAMHKLLKPAKEVPVAVAHHIAGVAALELLRFVDEGASQLIGASARIEYHRPTTSAQQTFTRHPACGCNW